MQNQNSVIPIIGLDLGNHNIKSSSGFICRSVCKEFNYSDEVNERGFIVYEGKKYVIGSGDFDHTKEKSRKLNTMPLFLYALYKSLKVVSTNVNVVIGLPLVQHQNKLLVKEMREKYKKSFGFQITTVYHDRTETIDVYYNVSNVIVFPECVGAYYSLPTKIMSQDLLLVDIGGGTINLALFLDEELQDFDTIPQGTNNVYSRIADAANEHNLGATFSVEDIVRYMQFGQIIWEGVVDPMDYVDAIIDAFALTIVNQIKRRHANYKAYKILLSGGGAQIMNEALNRYITATVIDNNLFANAIGFHLIGCEFYGY
ncbi:MAG: hypothetical protein ATN35_02115 [Epulopiscium sp. Nele67-Bin004]|nr:MAG: hypothetical protein ATN35_02115 [Epulopiscium sp. Nele67-Bin004]